MKKSPSWEVPAIYGTRWFIIAFTTAHHLFLSCARSIQSILPTKFFKIHFNSILLSMPTSSKWSLSHTFPDQKPCRHFFPQSVNTPRPVLCFHFITHVICGEQCWSWSAWLCGLFPSPLTSSLLRPIYSSAAYPSTHPAFNITDHFSHPHKKMKKYSLF